jgi:hypothetical protein
VEAMTNQSGITVKFESLREMFDLLVALSEEYKKAEQDLTGPPYRIFLNLSGKLIDDTLMHGVRTYGNDFNVEQWRSMMGKAGLDTISLKKIHDYFEEADQKQFKRQIEMDLKEREIIPGVYRGRSHV